MQTSFRHITPFKFPIKSSFGVIALLFLLHSAAFALSGRVTKVHDGDTFTLLDAAGQMHKIRVHGIDCPELNQPFGKSAREYAKGLLLNRQVNIQGTKKDRYKRLIGIVFLPDGSNFNERMLLAGMAWHFTKYDSNPLWTAMEREARNQKRGLWISPSAIAPWDWRKRKS